MGGKHKFRREGGFDYAPLFGRIEEAFDPEEMTASELKKYLNVKTPGMEGFAEQLSFVSEIANQINTSTDINELKSLRSEASKLPLHNSLLLRNIEEKRIALSIELAQEFAEEKRITLTEKIKGNLENWQGQEVITIRDEKGRFKTWKRV